jgi:hypothetical protein
MNSWGYNGDTGNWVSRSELYNTTFQAYSFVGMLPAAVYTGYAHGGPMLLPYQQAQRWHEHSMRNRSIE